MSKTIRIVFWIVAVSNGIQSTVMTVDGWFFMDGASHLEVWRHDVEQKLAYITFLGAALLAELFGNRGKMND